MCGRLSQLSELELRVHSLYTSHKFINWSKFTTTKSTLCALQVEELKKKKKNTTHWKLKIRLTTDTSFP